MPSCHPTFQNIIQYIPTFISKFFLPGRFSRENHFSFGVFFLLWEPPRKAPLSRPAFWRAKGLAMLFGQKNKIPQKSFPEQPQSCQVTSQNSAFCWKSEHQVTNVLVEKTLTFRWRYLLTNWSQNQFKHYNFWAMSPCKMTSALNAQYMHCIMYNPSRNRSLLLQHQMPLMPNDDSRWNVKI